MTHEKCIKFWFHWPWIKFHWNNHPNRLCITCDCYCATKAGMSHCNRNCTACDDENTCYLVLWRKSAAPVLSHSIHFWYPSQLWIHVFSLLLSICALFYFSWNAKSGVLPPLKKWLLLSICRKYILCENQDFQKIIKNKWCFIPSRWLIQFNVYANGLVILLLNRFHTFSNAKRNEFCFWTIIEMLIGNRGTKPISMI